MAQNELQEIFEVGMQESYSPFIKTTRQELYSHQIALDKPIGEPSMYRDLINLLYTADETTEFNFLINSPGGSMSACMAIVEAIKNTEGVVRAIITGECHSAASIIALHCHEIIVTDSASMLVHTASYGSVGNSYLVKGQVDFSYKMINKILRTTYDGFLTPEEMVSVEMGIELWFDAESIADRVQQKIKFLKSKEEPEVVATTKVKKTK